MAGIKQSKTLVTIKMMFFLMQYFPSAICIHISNCTMFITYVLYAMSEQTVSTFEKGRYELHIE